VLFPDGTRFEGTFDGALAGAEGTVLKPDGTRSAARIVDGEPRPIERHRSGIIPRPNTEASHG
jgi:hypothetical protein